MTLLLAEIGKGDGQLGPDLVAYRARNANPAGLGERFEPGRDVDTVAKQILALDEDIADMHADAEAHWLTHGAGGVFFGDGILNCDRTLDGVDRTGEVGDDTVAGAAEDAPATGGDQLLQNYATGGQPTQGADLVLPHQPAVAFDIGRKDRRELADRFFFLANEADEPEAFAVRRANKALFLSGVADRTARRIDPGAQRRLRDDAPAPYGGEQIVLAGDPLTVADQVLEEVENLRLEGISVPLRRSSRRAVSNEKSSKE